MKILNAFDRRKKDDLFNVSNYLLNESNTNFTKKKLAEHIREHREYPSLLALKDSLSIYGIESAAIRKGEYRLEDFETPFISSIQREGWPKANFTVVTKVESNLVEFIDPISHKKDTTSVEQFERLDKDVILLVDSSSPKDEDNFLENKKIQRNSLISKLIPLFLVFIALLSSSGSVLFAHPFSSTSVYGLIFLLTSCVGLLTTVLLVWHEIDAHNPFLKEVCGGGNSKLNCDAVLSSSSSAFLGINWSAWGFAFFATFFTIQVFLPANPPTILLWSYASLLVSPYIVFSVYQQWFVIKQWCPLCLTVQVILAINAIVSAFYLFTYIDSISSLDIYTLTLSLLTGLSLLIVVYIAIPLLRRANDSKDYEQKWKNLRYSPEIFQALLERSEKITFPVDGLGIVIGNPEAQHEIIKVCNPYCGPCANAHPELESILHKNTDVKIRIIFTATGEDNDMKTPPVAHLLAIQQLHGQKVVHRALDDWYLASVKDYDTFAMKYPMNGELKDQKDKMQAMNKWCNDMKIRATPTIYVNGMELPDSYKVADLKNFF